MQVGLIDGGGDGEHGSAGLVQISKIFSTQNDFSLGQCHLTKYSVVFAPVQCTVMSNMTITLMIYRPCVCLPVGGKSCDVKSVHAKKTLLSIENQ